MKKILCLLLCIALLSGCGGKVDEKPLWKSITDDTGYEVVFTEQPKKVAVLFSSYAQMWILAGGEVAITVQESIDRGICDENVILVDDKSGHNHIDTETLIASKPDFVIGTADYKVQVDAVNLCREAGIPGALFKVESYSDFGNMLFDICQLTEKSEWALEYVTDMNSEINSIFKTLAISDEPKEKILFVRAGSAARSTKAKTKDENFACKMLYQLGTYNIAENAPVLLDGLSIEEIMAEDPKHIFISTMGDENAAKEYVTSLFKEEGWNSLSAIKEGNVHFLPKDLFHYKPNDRWAEAYRYLANILYPRLFDE